MFSQIKLWLAAGAAAVIGVLTFMLRLKSAQVEAAEVKADHAESKLDTIQENEKHETAIRDIEKQIEMANDDNISHSITAVRDRVRNKWTRKSSGKN